MKQGCFAAGTGDYNHYRLPFIQPNPRPEAEIPGEKKIQGFFEFVYHSHESNRYSHPYNLSDKVLYYKRMKLADFTDKVLESAEM